MRCLYHLFIRFFQIGIFIASIFHKKARLWRKGRKHVFDELTTFFQDKNQDIVWFHAASLGEFEQGSPVMEAYKKEHPDHLLLLTFFSPSGYESKKHYQYADFICYLPLDTKKNAQRFLHIVKPTKIFFIKYEFWFNYMCEAFQQQIKVFSISSIFRKEQYFFAFYGQWFLKQLSKVEHFFVQNQSSVDLLRKYGITQTMLSGDTRFDRVCQVAQQDADFPLIERFKGSSALLVAGSSWLQDETLICRVLPLFRDRMKVIFVPHEIHEQHIKQLEQLSPFRTLRYSQATEENISDAEVLIIDQIGILSKIYRYADFTYIGGGFGKGIHNVLEAAVYGKPVFFGPNYHKFQEAEELLTIQNITSIENSEILSHWLHIFLEDHVLYQHICHLCFDYVQTNQGATKKILDYLRSCK